MIVFQSFVLLYSLSFHVIDTSQKMSSLKLSKKMSLEAKKNQFNKVLQNKTFSNFLFLSRSHYCVNQVKLVNNWNK